MGDIVASQFGSGVCGDSCGGSISPPSVLHAPVQLVCRYSLLLCTKVLWKALGHPGCGFPFQMITAFFQSSDCSNSFSSAVKARRSPPLRINLVEGESTCRGGYSNQDTESWVLLRSSQVLDGTQGFCLSASGSKPWGPVHPGVKGLTIPAFDFLFVMVFHLTFNRLVRSQVTKTLGTRGSWF